MEFRKVLFTSDCPLYPRFTVRFIMVSPWRWTVRIYVVMSDIIWTIVRSRTSSPHHQVVTGEVLAVFGDRSQVLRVYLHDLARWWGDSSDVRPEDQVLASEKKSSVNSG